MMIIRGDYFKTSSILRVRSAIAPVSATETSTERVMHLVVGTSDGNMICYAVEPDYDIHALVMSLERRDVSE